MSTPSAVCDAATSSVETWNPRRSVETEVSATKLGPRGGRWRHTISTVETWTPLNDLAKQEVERRRSQLFAAVAASASVDGTCNDIACEGEEDDRCQLAPVVTMEPATKKARKAMVEEAFVEETLVEAEDEGDEGDGRGKEGACNEGSKEDTAKAA